MLQNPKEEPYQQQRWQNHQQNVNHPMPVLEEESDTKDTVTQQSESDFSVDTTSKKGGKRGNNKNKRGNKKIEPNKPPNIQRS